MNYYAHTATKLEGTPDSDYSRWQPLATHLRTWGDLACFTRPEMKVERVSHPVITPSAALLGCEFID